MTKFVRALACIVLLACSDSTSEPTPGGLQVSIVGLPATSPASATVAGPGGFTRAVTATTTIPNLAPGVYTLTATNVATGGATYIATPATQTVTVLAGATATSTVTYAVAADDISLALETVASGLDNPLFVTSPPGDPRLFVVEQSGRIRIISATGTTLATPFLDVRSLIVFGGEQGLLSMAFHPSYATNGFFFVNYTDTRGDTRVVRYHVSADPNVADAASASLILTVAQPYVNHNGGLVMFGPDGMLYIGMGDGGAGGDPLGNGQNRNALLGKLLRIDVNGAAPYAVPSSNPFVGQSGVRPEIWALGLRNPWRFAFDRVAGLLYIADVGQNEHEELDVVNASQGGQNYGWNIMEGAACYAPSNCSQTGLTLPILDYRHNEGCSITGGFVYRGTRLPEVVGRYFYSDACSGWLRSLRVVDGKATALRDWGIPAIGSTVTSFGEDAAGELYMTSSAGRVYRIVRK